MKLQDLLKNKIFLPAISIVFLFLIAALSLHSEQNRLADIDGTIISEQQIETILRRQLSALNQQIYSLKRQKLDELIDAQLLTEEARRRGFSVATLLEQEVDSRALLVSEEDIRSFYESHKNRLNVEFDRIHDQIRDHINQQRREARRKEYFKALRAKAKVVTYLKAPPALRAEVSITGAPFKGSEKAQVTIVKFEDFECPFCKTVQPTINLLFQKSRH